MIAYSGNELKEHTTKLKNSAKLQTGLNKIYERDFVDSIRKFCFNGETRNIANEDKYRLHMVNPSLTYQMVSAIFDSQSADERQGKALEAYTVAYMSIGVHPKRTSKSNSTR